MHRIKLSIETPDPIFKFRPVSRDTTILSCSGQKTLATRRDQTQTFIMGCAVAHLPAILRPTENTLRDPAVKQTELP